MSFEPVTLNKAKCLVCSDILISEDAGKYITCSCGELTISGGHFCLYRKGEKYKEMSKLNESLVPHDVNDEPPENKDQ